MYKRHTNFAMEVIPQTINGTAGNNQRISVTIARNGDLVGYMYAQLTPTSTSMFLTSNNNVADTCWIAERAFSAIELTIGGQRIDKHFQTWWRVYSELNLSDENKVQYNKMTSLSNPQATNQSAASQGVVYLPFIFFFNRNPGLYLPLIALQYHEVRLDIDCATNYATYFGTAQPTIWANYVFLDTEERRRFAQKGHEYLIEQVQHTGGDTIPSNVTETSAATIRLSFNHPVKELAWVYQSSSFPSASLNALWNFTSNVANVNVTVSSLVLANTSTAIRTTELGSPQVLLANVVNVSTTTLGSPASPLLSTVASFALNGWTEEGAPAASAAQQGGLEVGPLHQFKLILNGQDRFKEQFGKFFNQIQPFYHHTGNPYPGIYNYSFALHPEEHQPTGTCNFSRIDNAQVQLWLKNRSESSSAYIQKLFAVNYNILRIQSGMGGLAFSN